jgi:hypothetical protein
VMDIDIAQHTQEGWLKRLVYLPPVHDVLRVVQVGELFHPRVRPMQDLGTKPRGYSHFVDLLCAAHHAPLFSVPKLSPAGYDEGAATLSRECVTIYRPSQHLLTMAQFEN